MRFAERALAMATSSAASTMDLESYLTNYTGVTRLKRLAFIASASPALKAEALRLAVDEVKRTTNTAQYAELLAIAGDALKRDDAWVDAEDKKAVHKLERLDYRISTWEPAMRAHLKEAGTRSWRPNGTP